MEDPPIKDPDAVLDWAFDWSPWLEDGEAITSHTITVDDGLDKDSDSESGGKVTVWLSGGTAGEKYNVACLIQTSMGRKDERTFRLTVRER